MGWPENTLLLSVNKAFKVGELSVSQKQAVIKLIEKHTKRNDLLKTGDQYLFSTLTKNWFKMVLAERLKTVLPSLISSNQTAYLNGRCISEGGRLISDIFEVSDC